MRQLSNGRVEVFSGGSEPANQVSPVVVTAMAEKGVDISKQQPKPRTDERLRTADVAVTMGCGDTFPVIPGRCYLDWMLDDPSGKTLEDVRVIRDDIENRVESLLAELVGSKNL